jgi:hypothetical protein
MTQVTVDAIQKLKFELFPYLVYLYSGDLIHVIYHSKICYMDATLHTNWGQGHDAYMALHTHRETFFAAAIRKLLNSRNNCIDNLGDDF